MRFPDRNRARKELAARRQRPLNVEFDIEAWLAQPHALVSRQDLYEFITRLEVGKKMRNRWRSRLRRLGRRVWGYLTRQELDVEDPFYRPGYPTTQPKEQPDGDLHDAPSGDRDR